MTSLPHLEHTFAQAFPDLVVPHPVAGFPDPQIVALNENLAAHLGLDSEQLRSADGVRWLLGKHPGTENSVAMAYAGHQFGTAVPVLGDGRAVLLGEILDRNGERRDLHIKGAGLTPFARPGSDGKAPLGAMLRELVIGESLHGLGIPTTRILAVATTGERIRPRQGGTPEVGAVAIRVAASHLRVGTFEYANWHRLREVKAELARYTLRRHFPQVDAEEASALTLLGEVVRSQAELIAQWMLSGFVHGVMNTDNMALSGESIDFGPCAFMDQHRAGAVFSSIDRQGRYAYANQPGAALWNLSRFAETLLNAINPEEPREAIGAATKVLETFADHYHRAWQEGLARKLAIPAGDPAKDGPVKEDPVKEVLAKETPAKVERADDSVGLPRVGSLGDDLFAMLEAQQVDHTNFFRALTDGDPRSLFREPGTFDQWQQRLHELRGSGPEAHAAKDALGSVNPVYVPRTVQLNDALTQAENGDLSMITAIVDAVRKPFDRKASMDVLEYPARDAGPVVTYCGT